MYSRLHAVTPIPVFGPAMEDLGFDGVWVTEGLVNEQAALDAVVALQSFADHTRSIRVGTCVILLPLRNPVILAKQIASVDYLSGGRVDFGVGVGGSRNSNRAGFEATGVPLEGRGRRADEYLAMINRLWSGEPVNFDGEFHSLSEVSMEPRPSQRPRVSTWVGGGSSDPVLRRTARWGDGWVPAELNPAGYAEGSERISRHCEEAGRDPGAIRLGVHLYLSIDDRVTSAFDAARRALTKRYGFPVALDPDDAGRYAFGTKADCIRAIEGFQRIGVTDFVLNVARPLPEVLPQLERFEHEVMPHFR